MRIRGIPSTGLDQSLPVSSHSLAKSEASTCAAELQIVLLGTIPSLIKHRISAVANHPIWLSTWSCSGANDPRLRRSLADSYRPLSIGWLRVAGFLLTTGRYRESGSWPPVSEAMSDKSNHSLVIIHPLPRLAVYNRIGTHDKRRGKRLEAYCHVTCNMRPQPIRPANHPRRNPFRLISLSIISPPKQTSGL